MVKNHKTKLRERIRQGLIPCTEKGFWDFTVERHRIWWKKTIQRDPSPWTDDPILRTFHFCNIYRDLDTGTAWYRTHVVRQYEQPRMHFADAVWATIIYRLVNSIWIFERIGSAAFDRSRWREMIAEIRARDILLNSEAYLTFPWPHKYTGEGSRTTRFEYILGRLELEFDGIVHDLQEAKTLQEVGERLKTIYGIGPFLSLQIYRDLILTGFLPFSSNDWVEIGIGAVTTLRVLYGEKARSDKQRRRLIYKLTGDQDRQLGRRGWGDFETRDLTACDIENCLCEYGKYAKLVAGVGRKRYYDARVRS